MSKNTETIDTTPWDGEIAASRRAQQQRLGRHGLALTRDGALRCVRCKKVVLAAPRGQPFAVGAPVSALQAMHEAEGCR